MFKKYKIIADNKQLKELSLGLDFKHGQEVYLKEYGERWFEDETGYGFPVNFVVPVATTNREKLRDFITANNIRTNAVSRALGYKKNWLSQHIGRKDRKDMSDETLNNILKKLHIDWTSDQFLTVKAEVPYRTKPCNYSRTQDKERLQRAFWDGLVKA